MKKPSSHTYSKSHRVAVVSYHYKRHKVSVGVSLISSGSCGIQISLGAPDVIYSRASYHKLSMSRTHDGITKLYHRDEHSRRRVLPLSYDNLVITCQLCKLHHHLYIIPVLGKPAVNRDLDLRRFLICSGASHSKLFPCYSLDLPFVWGPSWYIITIVSGSNW